MVIFCNFKVGVFFVGCIKLSLEFRELRGIFIYLFPYFNEQ